MKERMYKDTKTWNPFVGCNYGCVYCKPSFQKVVAWVGRMRGCKDCQTYSPHYHPERLTRIPNERMIFVCGDSDITFAKKDYMRKIFEIMREDKRKNRVWLVQSKNPSCLNQYLKFLPENTILDTTLETNRDEGYDKISKAPKPSKRIKEFADLKWKHKLITIEPIVDFDLEPFVEMIISASPEAVFIGYNSRPKQVFLKEPKWNKFLALWRLLRKNKINVLPKETRKGHIPKRAYRDYNWLNPQKTLG